MEIHNQIIVCRDFDFLTQHIEENYKKYNLKIFSTDEFLIDDARAVIKEAYIAESSLKVIVMMSKSYNIYAQNSLLKILEEPPKNIKFILCVASKNVLLPTVRSRLKIKTIKVENSTIKTNMNFKKLEMKDINTFLEDKKFLDKNTTKVLLQCILQEAIEQGLRLKTDEIDIFPKLIHLAELNSRSHYLLLTALLVIYNRQII